MKVVIVEQFLGFLVSVSTAQHVLHTYAIGVARGIVRLDLVREAA